MSPRPSPCDGFTGNLPSYSDHELGPAERSALEVHLEGCPRCQARLKELETVSNVLKGWDARLPAGETAAVRLQNAVLARIEEDGVRRRREVRWTRMRRLALAAAVLLAVGVPFALGRRSHGDDATRFPGGDELVTYTVVKAPAAAAPRMGGAGPALTAERLPPDALAHRPLVNVEATPPDPLPSEQRDALLRMGLGAQREIEQEKRFRELTGTRGVWVVDPATGARLHVSREAAQVFGPGEPSSGMLHIPTLHRKRDEPYTGPLLVEPGELGKTPGDLLRNVLEGDEGTRAWRNRQNRQRPYHLGAPGSSKHRLSAYALAPRSNEPGVEVLDPLDAQALGLLRFAASGTSPTTVVAFVEGNELPIFLPAGQLLTGGVADRVTARPIWLPASTKRAWFEVPVAVVSAGPKRAEEGIQVTPWVAGPTLRALLAAGAAPQAILDHVRSLVAHAGSLDFSLLELFGRKDSAVLFASEDNIGFSGRAANGFLVTDAAARFLGLEHVAIEGENGTLLVRRLLHGYVLEGLRRGAIVKDRSKLSEALDGVVSGEASLRVPQVAPGAAVVGVVRAALADATGAYDVLRVGSHVVWISALPR